MNDLVAVAERFNSFGKMTGIQEFGNGNINNTFLVTIDSSEEKFFILQRVNRSVFLKPELVMRNIRVFSEHVNVRLKNGTNSRGRKWEIPRIIPCRDSNEFFTNSDGSFWRAFSFIYNSQSFETIKNPEHAEEVGFALGMFHSLLSDLPPEKLEDTLEGFHITPRYLKNYEEVMAKPDVKKSPEVDFCQNFISERAGWVSVLEDAKASGRIPSRTIHGDPKVSNIMMDINSGKAVGIVDLDTIKPGLIHYDIGDCIRSGCNPLGEETKNWREVSFDPDFCRAILRGYLSSAREFLIQDEYDLIYDSIRLIAFELGLRFFTDYLLGNVYFKAKHREHNLSRALVQFKLCESIESQSSILQTIIRELQQ